jgi:hypothetical protein
VLPLRLLVIVLLLGVATAGCAKVHAKTEPEMPLLTPPPPPPRIIEAYDAEVPPPPPPEANDTAPDSAPARPPAKPPAPRVDATAKPEVPRTEPEPEPERPATPPPALTLKPAPGTESTTEASIRAMLSRASRDLTRVNRTSLNPDGKAQYDTASRFMQQAEAAMRAGNLVFAGKLADKAATMASVLVR